VQELTERLREVDAAVFADFRGLSVSDAGELRTALAEVDTQLAVVKNTLARIAARDAELDGVEGFLEGPTAIAFVKGDPVAAAKAIVDAAKRFPVLEVKGGYAEGRVLSAADVGSLAALDSREVMLARLAGLFQAQMSRTAYLLQALQSKLLSLLEAYREKLPSDGGTDPGAEDQPAAAEAEQAADAEGEQPADAETDAGPAAETEQPADAEAAETEPPAETETETDPDATPGAETTETGTTETEPQGEGEQEGS
ncbi:MAG TPA: 50S ribosomal protein L10, partial [Actinomycetota bacterium]|nr:50S ribosomal protein L10 [Actinomycetota bacterium]